MLVARALVVLHHGVIPHLTRAVLIMDWVGSCVDHGGHVGLLALNALFVLMREYNLYVYPKFSLDYCIMVNADFQRLPLLLYTALRLPRPHCPTYTASRALLPPHGALPQLFSPSGHPPCLLRQAPRPPRAERPTCRCDHRYPLHLQCPQAPPGTNVHDPPRPRQ